MFSENAKIVPILVDDGDFGANIDLDSINMSGFHKATFIFTFGVTGADVVFYFKSGTTEGAKTNYVVGNIALGGAAIGTAVAASTASCDVLGAWSALTTTATLTCSTKMVVVEINASSMTSGDTWLTGNIACATGIGHCVAILEPRYSSNRSGTCLK